jgi:hypothetical protein
MRDAGVPSRHERSKLANKLAKTVQDQMVNWTEDNFTYFEQTMDMIREGAPVQWVKLYMEAVKLGLDKTTNINININREQDRANLQALVKSRIPSALPQSAPDYTPYIEIPKKEESAR